ncbi:MAG TPA: sulfite exporter TauE/SafE family protein [Gammaproteobacteria bacterium]|nr:sulfite exporter TauE/SafE family protein [Gammaproteobacteria bacterium]
MSLTVSATAAYLGIVAIASFVQALTGFALGLIVMGAATALALAPVSFTAAVISLFGVANGLWVLRTHHPHIDRPAAVQLTAGMVPGVVLGLFALHQIEGNAPVLLRHALGVFIALAGLLLIARPHPFERISRPVWGVLAGFAGGVFAGLFSAPVPFVFYLYRQPLPVATIRATLLVVFVVATAWRIVWLALQGGMTGQMLLLGALALPVIALSAHLALKVAHRVPALVMRRIAFLLLILLGLMLLVR